MSVQTFLLLQVVVVTSAVVAAVLIFTVFVVRSGC